MAGFFEISFSLLKDQGIFAEHSDAGVTFRDESEPMRLFSNDAVQSLVATVVLTILTTITFGCGGILFLVMLWWAYQAYQGQDVKIPMISDFIRNQGWA